MKGIGAMNKITFDKDVQELAEKLATLGEVLYVGGCVRDAILDKDVNDVDFATNIPMDVLEANFETHDIGANKDFGIVVIRWRGENYEVAQYRTENSYSDGRHPDVVKIVNTFAEDVTRRDFTINALGATSTGDVVDLVGGMSDIENGIIRAVGIASERFSEDYLRMLRAIRFAARFDFTIEKKTWLAIVENAANIKLISKERVWGELWKMAKTGGSGFAQAIMMMEDCGLLQHILPEIDNLKYMPHNNMHHPEGLGFK